LANKKIVFWGIFYSLIRLFPYFSFGTAPLNYAIKEAPGKAGFPDNRDQD
jgi:hypothetical protein